MGFEQICAGKGLLRTVSPWGSQPRTGSSPSVATEDSRKPHRTEYCFSHADGALHIICSYMRFQCRFTFLDSRLPDVLKLTSDVVWIYWMVTSWRPCFCHWIGAAMQVNLLVMLDFLDRPQDLGLSGHMLASEWKRTRCTPDTPVCVVCLAPNWAVLGELSYSVCRNDYDLMNVHADRREGIPSYWKAKV